MDRIKRAIVVAAALLASVCHAQSAPADSLEAVINKFSDLRNAHDWKALSETYSEGGEYVATSGMHFKGRSSLQRIWSDVRGRAQRTISSVELLTPEIAPVRVAADGTDPDGVRVSETFLVVKTDGDWKIKMQQATLAWTYY